MSKKVRITGRRVAYRVNNPALCVFYPEGNTPFFSMTPTKLEDHPIPKFNDFCLKVSIARLVLYKKVIDKNGVENNPFKYFEREGYVEQALAHEVRV